MSNAKNFQAMIIINALERAINPDTGETFWLAHIEPLMLSNEEAQSIMYKQSLKVLINVEDTQ